MLQNMLVAAVTPLQNMDEITCWENRPFSGRWPKSEDDTTKTGIKRTIKKKTKRIRTAYTTDQLRTLERIFVTNKYISTERRREIAHALKISDKSVKIWFQNRRMKEKRSSSESDSSCDTSGEVSPPLPPEESEYLPAPSFYPDSYQGTFCYNSQEQTEVYNADSSAYGIQFCNDNNMYPTQFYPTNEYHYPNDYFNYNNHQQNAYYNNYWVNTGVNLS